jgi:outer membrane lipoprotein-sorting protein
MPVRSLVARSLGLVVAMVFAVGLGIHPDVVAGQRSTRGDGAPTFDELYARGQQANKGITTLAAHFTETTTNALLRADRPIVARGMLFVQRPSRVALLYTDPADQRIVIDGKWMTTTAQGIQRKMDVGAAQDRVQKYFVQSDAAELRRVFDIELRERSSRPGTHEVVMVPKRKQIKETLSKLELWVGDGTALLKAMRMTFANGDTKLMEFDNVVANGLVDPGTFNTGPANAAPSGR